LGQRGRPLLGEHHDRPCFRCRLDETRAVGAAAGERREYLPGTDRAAVRGNACDLPRRILRIDLNIGRKDIVKFHNQ
jgi:hypothetical protein